MEGSMEPFETKDTVTAFRGASTWTLKPQQKSLHVQLYRNDFHFYFIVLDLSSPKAPGKTNTHIPARFRDDPKQLKVYKSNKKVVFNL